MIYEKSLHERRKNPRLEDNIPIKICQEDGDLVAEIKNISRSGAYCCVDRKMAPMTRLKIHLLLSTIEKGKKCARKISCEGVVVRSSR